MRSSLAVLVVLAACGGSIAEPLGGELGDSTGAGAPGGSGIDPGGAQDIGAARELILGGGVPPADYITVEGLLSEHDVPTLGAPCDSAICLRPATAVGRSLETGALERWVHIGMTSGIDLSTFVRPPVDLAIAIDKSSSMSGDLKQTTEAVARLIGTLRPDDRLRVVAFDDTLHVIHPFGPAGDVAALQAAVRALPAGGGWNLPGALDDAYGTLAPLADSTRVRRVIVLSCGYPSISASLDDPTSAQIHGAGVDGIGTTFVGVLLGWSPNLAALLGKTNGGNYYYTQSLQSIEQVFDSDADLMLAPVAYDLMISTMLASGWQLARMYGLPGNADGSPAASYEVATAFLSHRRGSIVARLAWIGAGSPGPAAATTTLSYRPEPALGWTAAETQSADAVVGPLEPDGTFYAGNGVRKAVFLVNMAERMIAGCAAWSSGDLAKARATIQELLDYLTAEQAVLADADLDVEVALVTKLLANMAP